MAVLKAAVLIEVANELNSPQKQTPFKKLDKIFIQTHDLPYINIQTQTPLAVTVSHIDKVTQGHYDEEVGV